MKAIHFLSLPCVLLTAGSIGVRLAAFESLAVDDPLFNGDKTQIRAGTQLPQKKKGDTPPFPPTKQLWLRMCRKGVPLEVPILKLGYHSTSAAHKTTTYSQPPSIHKRNLLGQLHSP